MMVTAKNGEYREEVAKRIIDQAGYRLSQEMDTGGIARVSPDDAQIVIVGAIWQLMEDRTVGRSVVSQIIDRGGIWGLFLLILADILASNFGVNLGNLIGK